MIIYYFSLYLWCLRRPRRARGIASSPYALLGFSYYPFVTPGTACQGAVTAWGYVRLSYPFLGGQFYDAAIDMVALLPCLDHAQTALNLCRFLSVEHAYTEPQGLIVPSAPTLIYGGRGLDGRSYISHRVGTASFRARHTLRRA